MRWSQTPLSVIGVVLLGTLALNIQPYALAQEATPTMGIWEAINPSECQVEPIPAERLIALWFPDEATTPVAAPPGNSTVLSSVPLPLGEPADPETVAEITAIVRELLACQNRIENGRFFTFFTDAMLRTFAPPPDEPFGPEDVAALLVPYEPIPVAEYIRLLAVTDVLVMADGRVGALVVSDDPPIPPDGPETQLMLFVEEEGRWLVDGVATFTAVEPLVGDEEGPADSMPTP